MILSQLDEFGGRLSEIRVYATNFCESHLLAEQRSWSRGDLLRVTAML